MRNEMTDQYGDRLQTAFIKSGMDADSFCNYLSRTRNASIHPLGYDQPTVFVHLDVGVLQCYFTNNRWFCKF